MHPTYPAIPTQPDLGPGDRALGDRALPAHLYRTYELVLDLAWRNDQRRTAPITRRHLAHLRGVAERTIDHHLHALRQLGYLRNAAGRAGLPLVLLPGGGSPRPPAMADPSLATTVSSLPDNPCSHTEQAASCPVATDAARQTAPQPTPPSAPPAGAPHDDDPPTDDAERVAGPDIAATIDLLTRCGIYPGVARRLAHNAWVTPGLVLAWYEELCARRNVRHVGGLLATLLRSPKSCLPAPRPVGRASLGAAPHADEEAGDESDAQPPAMAASLMADEPPPRDGVRDVPWNDVLSRLREALDDRAVNLWLGPSRPLTWEDGVLVVGVHNHHALDWLGSHWASEINRAAVWALGCPVSVRFVVGG